MSSPQINTSSTTPPPPPSDSPAPQLQTDPPVRNPAGTDDSDAASELLLNAAKDVRQIIRLVQCRVCSRVLREPTTLPCGQSLCKQCIPQTHVRTNISWPATENRLHGFECPFEDCKKEHALGDCSVDITLNKVISNIRASIEQDREEADSSHVSMHTTVQDMWQVAGIPTLGDREGASRVSKGGRIVTTYTLAETGSLEYGCEVMYTTIEASEDEVSMSDEAVFMRFKESARIEMDCQVCYALYLDPITTTCGHTFCRNCLHRVLSHAGHCPVCRRGLFIHPQLDPDLVNSNHRLTQMINGFWADVVALRAQAARDEQEAGELDTPLFVCTLSFPAMPTFLHVFEPRYRLMIRRAMEADRTFGMVLEKQRIGADGWNFHEIGTLLRISNVEFFPDGRSLLETVGVSRFRVIRHDQLDGYVIGKIEKIDDVSLAEEEAAEVSETMRGQGVRDFIQPPQGDGSGTQNPAATQASPIPLTVDNLETMATRDLVEVGVTFVRNMRAQSVAWLTVRVLAVYGECPTDPALFPWWFASVLPVSDDEKYRLLGTSSVRERLKICCRWIVEWESTRW
jgi:hypothetical protein